MSFVLNAKVVVCNDVDHVPNCGDESFVDGGDLACDMWERSAISCPPNQVLFVVGVKGRVLCTWCINSRGLFWSLVGEIVSRTRWL